MIEVDRLSKRFGAVTAVDDLSFTVRPGRVTGFLGPNGAGKTTTMRVILGLDAPTSGRALVAGRRYDELIRPLREVGSLLDATALHAGRTAWAHLLSIAQANGIAGRRVTEVLRLTGLEGVARRRVGGFSLDLLASEWTKFRSVRSTFWSLLVAVVTPVAVSVVVAVAFANARNPGPPPDPLLPGVISLEYALIAVAEPVTRRVFTVSRRGGDRKPAVRVVLDALADAAGRPLAA